MRPNKETPTRRYADRHFQKSWLARPPAQVAKLERQHLKYAVLTDDEIDRLIAEADDGD